MFSRIINIVTRSLKEPPVFVYNALQKKTKKPQESNK